MANYLDQQFCLGLNYLVLHMTSVVIGTSFRMGGSTFMLNSGIELLSSIVKTLEKNNLLNTLALPLSNSTTQPSDVIKSLMENLACMRELTYFQKHLELVLMLPARFSQNHSSIVW